MEILTCGTAPCFVCGKRPRLLIHDLYNDELARPHTVCAECHHPPIDLIDYYEVDPHFVWATLTTGEMVTVPCHVCDPYWRPFKGEVTKREPVHKTMRNVLAGYTVFEQWATNTGKYDLEFQGTTFNFLDLQGALSELSPRLMDAVYFGVIQDEEQKQVAARLGVSNATVNQHIDQACIQLVAKLWPEGVNNS